jgi:hypothetical protein
MPPSAENARDFSEALCHTSDREGPKDQTSDAQLRIGESRDSGFDASHRPGMTDREIFSRHCKRQRSNPAFRKASVDCFVAFAPRNDECDRLVSRRENQLQRA